MSGHSKTQNDIFREWFYFENYRSEPPKMTDKLIRKFTNSFRETFCNKPYNQFLFFPSEGTPISPQEVFNTQEKYFDLETLDSFDSRKYKHPITNEEALLWQDPETIFQKFHEKFRKDAFLTIMTRQKSGDIAGAAFGYIEKISKVFEQEEWKDPTLYSKHHDPNQFRSFDNFLKRIQEATKSIDGIDHISEETRVFCLNCIFIKPEIQGNNNGLAIMGQFLQELPREIDSLPVICEMIVGTEIYNTAIQNGGIAVPGILSDESELKPKTGVIMVSQLKKYIKFIAKKLLK